MAPSPATNFALRGPGGFFIGQDGGPLPGYGESIGNTAAFLGRRSVRDTWIAVSILWIVWAMFFVARQVFRPTRVFNAPRGERVAATNAPVSAEQGPYDVQDGLTPMPGGGAGNGAATTGVSGNSGVAGSGTATTGVSGNSGVAGNGTATTGVSGNSGIAGNGTATTGVSGNSGIAGNGTATTGVSGNSGGAGRRGGFFPCAVDDDVRDRIDRTYKLIRDLTLMLFLVVTLNTFGLGSGVPVLTLAWIYLAIALFWAGLMMLIDSRLIDLILGTVEMLLLLGIFIANYVVGWTVLD